VGTNRCAPDGCVVPGPTRLRSRIRAAADVTALTQIRVYNAAAMSSAVPLTQAVTSGDANAVRAALANGADVNERNNGGQTALILAVIFGHTHLAELLVKAGANPRLRDNLGLDAVEWAQRRGLSTDLFEIRGEEPRTTEPQTDSDEKSRKWLAGVKQRIQEQSAQKQPPVVQTQPALQTHPTVQTQPVVQAQPAPHPAPAPEPEPVLPEPDPVAAVLLGKTSCRRGDGAPRQQHGGRLPDHRKRLRRIELRRATPVRGVHDDLAGGLPYREIVDKALDAARPRREVVRDEQGLYRDTNRFSSAMIASRN